MKNAFYFYCSEVAACIGKHPYKKRWEAFETIFQRIDHSCYYEQCIQRQAEMGRKILTAQDKVENLKKLDLHSVIDTFLKEKISSSGNLCNAIDTFTCEIQQKDIQLKENKRKLDTMYVDQIAKENKLKKQLQDEINNNNNIIEQIQHTILPVVHDVFGPMPVLPVLLQPVSQYQSLQPIKPIEPLQSHTLTELKETQKITQSVVEQLSQCKEQCNNMKVAAAELIRQKQTVFGHEQEDLLVAKLGNISQNNAEKFTDILGRCNSRQWGLCGRIDGFQNGELIEIKNRKSQIFDPLPIYDVIQVQCYLHLLNLPKGKLIQSLALGNNEFETQETIIFFNKSMWLSEIITELDIFMKTLDNFCHDTLLQDQFYTTADNKKSVLFNKMLKKFKSS
jgi:hypothetical protein